MEGKLTINLAKDKRFDENRESLGELLDKCIEITGAVHTRASERERRREALRLARWAVRAIAEEILRIFQNGRTESDDDDGADWWKRGGFSRN
jgi:hypothetical protein